MPRGKKKVSRKRVPFGGHRTRLQAEHKPGYVRRWFNDVEDRVQRAIDAGYQFVEEEVDVGEGELHEGNTDLNGKVSKIVSKNTHPPIRAFLMEIPQEFYDEDQADKEKRNSLVDEAIRAGTPGGATVENAYGQITHSHR